MRTIGMFVVCTGLLLVMGARVFAQPAGGTGPAAAPQPVEKAYVMADIDELRRYPGDFKDKFIRLSDKFDSPSNLFPGTLQRAGITSAKFIAFMTSSSYGSNMLCYLSLEDKDAAALVNNLTRFAPITLEGAVYGVVNGMTVFMVDHLYSGYDVPKKEGKPQITMLMQWEGNAKKYKYVIPKPGQYVLSDPTTNKKITVEFQY